MFVKAYYEIREHMVSMMALLLQCFNESYNSNNKENSELSMSNPKCHQYNNQLIFYHSKAIFDAQFSIFIKGRN